MNKTIIIAEAGVNHNGDINIAKKLVDAAVLSGADIIKFQTFKAKNLSLANNDLTEYQKRNLLRKQDQQEMLSKLELSDKDHIKLFEYCKKSKIEFLTTAFDNESLGMIKKFNLKRYKIASGEITNIPLIREIGKQMKNVVLSTGMAKMADIEKAIEILEEEGTSRDDLIVLHCTSEYPAPIDDINLLAMKTISKTFKVKVGYSDHTDGIVVAISAVALGAVLIEKHLTLDNNMEGPDHKASLEPDRFKEMVKEIRNIERALGDGIKRVKNSESKNIKLVRKSIVASCKICKGEKFTNENLTTKRPENGLSSVFWDKLIGKEAFKDFEKDEVIKLF